MCAYVYMCMCMYAHMHVHVNVVIYIFLCVYACLCALVLVICVRMHVCTCARSSTLGESLLKERCVVGVAGSDNVGSYVVWRFEEDKGGGRGGRGGRKDGEGGMRTHKPFWASGRSREASGGYARRGPFV
jgi:uncharacterized membrane protein YgcG